MRYLPDLHKAIQVFALSNIYSKLKIGIMLILWSGMMDPSSILTLLLSFNQDQAALISKVFLLKWPSNLSKFCKDLNLTIFVNSKPCLYNISQRYLNVSSSYYGRWISYLREINRFDVSMISITMLFVRRFHLNFKRYLER